MSKKIFLIAFLCLALSTLFSCSSYQKLLKSQDYELKFSKAKEYYNKGDYNKAVPLFEELIGVYKGTKNVEDLYYFYPYCYYAQGDYILAAFYFKNFIDNYPRSERAEDARFMIAYCNYKLSPDVNLEQENTIKAIEAFQNFANAYPESSRITECNQLLDELRAKLENKSYQSAYLYYKMRDYKAAINAFNNLLRDFPETQRREKIEYLIVKSYYLLAEKSIPSKQEERYQKTTSTYMEFLEHFPQSSYLREAEKMYQDALLALDRIAKQNNNNSNNNNDKKI
ncbi:MAG: outer membrane protein assembly factor BamD [Sphingobacteriales bacterium]|nr:outer membrane protein assembly factor BamD [Sphingobacteriales bacterium]